MAKVLEDFEFRRGNAKYPWAEWMDGKTWEAVRGVDFHVTPAAFRTVCHSAAARHGGGVRVATDGDRVVFKFTPNTPEETE